MDSKEKLEPKKISDIVEGLPRLKVFDAELTAFEDKNPFTPQFPVVDKSTYLGLELEIENLERFDSGASPYWQMIEDGSLRNNGREFITPPIRAWRVEQALEMLFQHQINSDIDFSDRTSIHVHMNIRTLTVAQLEAMVLTYILFEKSLFKFVGENRYENIFCVPICETRLGTHLTQLIINKRPEVSWQKYSALNLLPITQKGTVEFRHLHGTKNVKKIMTWINLILSMKKFALRHEPDYIWHRIRTLNTSSEYRMFGEEVFGTLIEELFNDSFNTDVEECSIYIKNNCIANDFRFEVRNGISSKSTLAKYKLLGFGLRDRAPEPMVFLDEVHEEEFQQRAARPVRVNPANFNIPPGMTFATTSTIAGSAEINWWDMEPVQVSQPVDATPRVDGERLSAEEIERMVSRLTRNMTEGGI